MKKNNTKVIGMQIVDVPQPEINTDEVVFIQVENNFNTIEIRNAATTLEMFNSLATKADSSISGIDRILANVGWWIFSLPKIIKAIRSVIEEYKAFRNALRVKYSTDDIQAIFKQLEDFESEIYHSGKMEKAGKEGV